MINRVGIFGGSGFVGSHIVNELISKKFKVKAINRTRVDSIDSEFFSQVTTNLFSKKLYRHLKDIDCIIYNIGIIREFPDRGITFEKIHKDLAVHCIDMAKQVNIKKFILMSANGVEQELSKYQKTKLKAEHYLRKSGLNWTIFRPSLIYGNPNSKMEFCTQLKRDLINTSFPLPMFFKGFNVSAAGRFKMSPIHVKNVAEFFVKAINKDNTQYKVLELGGSHSYSWRELTDIISESCNIKKFFIPVPIFSINLLASILERFSWFPITRDQLVMLLEGNECDSKQLFLNFDIDEIKFSIKNLRYLL